MTRVIVAEKPSVARSIASALGLRARGGEGALVADGVIVTWCVGHLVELADPEDYDERWKRWSFDALPIVPAEFRLRPVARTRGQFRVVRDLLRRADVVDVVNACDSGREGELIFDLVYRLAGCRKPVLRLWTPSLTDEAIRAAYRAMKPGSAYVGLRDAARSRQEADWLVGINATRAQTLAARAAGGAWDEVYSIGRVQTPTLALLVAREHAIRTFVSRPYWIVVATFRIRGEAYDGIWFRDADGQRIDRLPTEEDARAIVARIGGRPARVASVENEERRTLPPLLYDLTALQREANRRFGFSAKKTLALAQALYETHKVLSYPRTASRHLTTDVAAELPDLLRALAQGDSPHARLAAALVAAGPPRLGRRYVDDAKVEDHHALLPTGRAATGLSDDERQLYDLVVRRLVAAHAPELVEQVTTAITVVGGETFRSRGLVIRDPGWTVFDPPHRPASAKRAEEEVDDVGDRPLPPLRRGDEPAVERVSPKERRTQPPRPYTEADLLAAMERAGRELEDEELRAAMKDLGLGTPATRAAILEGLLDRGYAMRQKKALRPTPKGIALVDQLAVPALASAALTGEWEAKLAQMARGGYARRRFVDEIVAFTRQVVAQIQAAPPPRPAVVATGPDHADRARGRAGAAAARTTRAPAAPAPVPCDTCRRATRVVFSRTHGRWCFRCDPCGKWVNPLEMSGSPRRTQPRPLPADTSSRRRS